jgi:hypothetical protein
MVYPSGNPPTPKKACAMIAVRSTARLIACRTSSSGIRRASIIMIASKFSGES